MDSTANILLSLVEPFVFPFLPHTRLFWLYLLAAIVLAYVVYRRTDASNDEQAVGFISFLLPKNIYLHRSARVDYRYFFVNHLSFVFLLAPLLLSAPMVAALAANAWEAWFGPSPHWGSPGLMLLAIYTVSIALAFDFGIFIIHYALHRVPVLWEFHKVHHSAEVLTPVTVYRVHPLDDLLYGVATGTATGLVHGTFAYLSGEAMTPIKILNIDAALFVFYLLGYNLRHSHIWLSYPAWLSRILISPAQHQIHHSIHPRHLDKNMGFIFAFWDGLMNSLYIPQGREDLTFGLGEDSAHDDYDGVLALYFMPFRKVFARWRMKWAPRT